MSNKANSRQYRLTANSLTLTRGGNKILDAVSLSVRGGELVGLIGPNGAGKSTLLELLAGIVPPDEGSVQLDDQALTSIAPALRAQRIAWLAQTADIHWPLSVVRLITLGRIPHLAPWARVSTNDRQAVEKAMQQVACSELKNRPVATLSGGEKARVLLARALATEPEVLLADEPVAALDLRYQLQTMDVIKRYTDEQRSAVVAMHDLSLAARYCNQLVLMNKGRLIASGPIAEVLTAENIASVYDVQVEIGTKPVPWVLPLKQLNKQ